MFSSSCPRPPRQSNAGTLTEQGLDLQGIMPVAGSRFGSMTPLVADLPLQLQTLMASCHGLSRLGAELVGDPLDQVTVRRV